MLQNKNRMQNESERKKVLNSCLAKFLRFLDQNFDTFIMTRPRHPSIAMISYFADITTSILPLWTISATLSSVGTPFCVFIYGSHQGVGGVRQELKGRSMQRLNPYLH
jgi:hypothetical protein